MAVAVRLLVNAGVGLGAAVPLAGRTGATVYGLCNGIGACCRNRDRSGSCSCIP